jgi:hypothetical protein
VLSLEELERPHPLSAKLAVAELKRYLPDPQQRIRQHDLVFAEVRSVTSLIQSASLQGQLNEAEFRRRTESYEAATQTLYSLIAVGAHWCRDEDEDVWCEVLRRLCLPIQAAGGMVAWIELKAYPAILAFYAAGLGAMSANRHRLIKRLFAQTLPHNGISAVRSLLPLIALPETLRVNIWTAVYSANNRVTPVSEHLFNLMKEDLREFACSIEDFEWLFDQFEILCALSYVDASIAFDEDPSAAERWFPVGRFSRHKSYYDERIKGVDNWVTQAATERDNWPPIAAGMFSGDYNRFSKLLAAFKNWFAKVPVY